MPSNMLNGAICWRSGRNGKFRKRHLLHNQRVKCGPTRIPLRVLVVLAAPTCLWLTGICFKRHVGFFWCHFIRKTPCLNQQYATATKWHVPISKMSPPAQRSCQSRGKSAAVINPLLLTAWLGTKDYWIPPPAGSTGIYTKNTWCTYFYNNVHYNGGMMRE